MRTIRFGLLPASSIAAAFLLCNASVALADDWAAYKSTLDAERKVVAAIKDSKDGTVATNILGVASVAILGVGFFTWNDHESAEENLADLRNDLTIIRTISAEKKCELLAS
jgi:hypothetical protein